MLLNVENMSCQHCVNTVTRALQVLDAAARVDVNLAKKQVHAQGNFSTEAAIAALADADYPATLVSGEG